MSFNRTRGLTAELAVILQLGSLSNSGIKYTDDFQSPNKVGYCTHRNLFISHAMHVSKTLYNNTQ